MSFSLAIYWQKCKINRVVFPLALQLVKLLLLCACIASAGLTQRCCFPLTAIPLSAAVYSSHTHTAFSLCSLYLHDHHLEHLTYFQSVWRNAPANRLNSHSTPCFHSRPAALMQSRLPHVSQWNTVSISPELLYLWIWQSLLGTSWEILHISPSWYLPLLTMRLFLRRCMVPYLTVSAALFALLYVIVLLSIAAQPDLSKKDSCGL